MSDFFYSFKENELLSNPSTERLIFLNLIRLLKPGFYFREKKWWDHGIFVSRNEENISFTAFSLMYSFPKKTRHDDPYPKNNIQKVYKCLSPMIRFLSKFLKDYFYCEENVISIYDIGRDGCIFINHAKNSVIWGHKTIVYIPEENKYDVDILKFNAYYEIYVKENRVIDIYCYNRWLCVYKFIDEVSKATMEPISLESFLMNQANKNILDSKNALEFNFRVTEDDHILTNKKVENQRLWTNIGYNLSKSSRTIYRMLKIESDMQKERRKDSRRFRKYERIMSLKNK